MHDRRGFFTFPYSVFATSRRIFWLARGMENYLKNAEVMKRDGAKPYFGKMHIFIIFRYNKSYGIDASFGCGYNIITEKCNYLHFSEVRSVRL